MDAKHAPSAASPVSSGQAWTLPEGEYVLPEEKTEIGSDITNLGLGLKPDGGGQWVMEVGVGNK